MTQELKSCPFIQVLPEEDHCLELIWTQINYGHFHHWVMCSCGYAGPRSNCEEGAVFNHNALPRHNEPEWLPIETAPKDKKILLTNGRWTQVAEWWANEEDDGQWIVYCSLISEPRLHFNPTHWMPLPNPPEEVTP